MTRTTLLIIILVVIGAGVAAAALVSSSGSGSSDTVSVSETIPMTTAATTTPTATIATTTTSGAQQSTSTQVEAAVTSYVQAAEEGDATTLCGLQVNTSASTSGATAAQACASKAGITLTDLPGLSQLKVTDVKISGDRATAQLLRIGQVTLVKVDGSWKVSSFSPARTKRNGGAEAPSGTDVGGTAAD
ncbi:MAG: hypothetical protein NWP31_01065 [Solirubrobacteraceae bacterium]|nr:hypothetical protein [Solirubrobacteraceae bacterium]MDP4673281.1 hypothetical protein [Solirubrobacteraceae bacterium]MDP4920910.1 hypothetical protein [Solirubrobacteraceae bacterium]MDP5033512.1 hypothetical protein [Solirubrobacteraceae bacterium]